MKKYRADAVNGNGKILHTTYVHARPQNAEKTARYALRLFVKGSFTVKLSPMFPEEDRSAA